MGRVPPLKVDRSKAVEDAAKQADIVTRARAATPITAGRDILASTDRDGYRHMIDMRSSDD